MQRPTPLSHLGFRGPQEAPSHQRPDFHCRFLADCGLSDELNRLIANAVRAFLEKKLHDIYEKFGAYIYRIEAAYTSQECTECGHIHAGNRKGETFKCRACWHAAHADENAAEAIDKRR